MSNKSHNRKKKKRKNSDWVTEKKKQEAYREAHTRDATPWEYVKKFGPSFLLIIGFGVALFYFTYKILGSPGEGILEFLKDMVTF